MLEHFARSFEGEVLHTSHAVSLEQEAEDLPGHCHLVVRAMVLASRLGE